LASGGRGNPAHAMPRSVNVRVVDRRARPRALGGGRASAVVLALLVSASIVSGCGDSSGEGTGEPGEVAVELEEQNDANVTGARAVFRYEDKNNTVVTVDGLDGGERAGLGANPVRIVHGTCAEPGEVAFELRPLTGSSAESTIDVGLDELYNGEYAIQVLFSETRNDPLACGGLPDEPPG
jgi:hypothetical protein